jgi:two-component sensor histidine kinase
MNTREKRLYYIHITLFFIFLGSALFIYLLSANIKKSHNRIYNEFKREVHITALALDTKGKISQERAKALESRSAIKARQAEYLNGTVSLTHLKDFVSPRLFEGAMVYNNIVWLKRTLPDGETVVEFRFPGYTPRMSSGESPLFFVSGSKIYMSVSHSLKYKGSTIGMDYSIFDLGLLLTKETSHYIDSAFISSKKNDGSPDSLSVMVGNTGYYLHAKPDKKSFYKARNIQVALVTVQTILSMTILIIVAYFFLLRRSLQSIEEIDTINGLLSSSLESKSLLLKELHHRVKNNLALIISFIELQASKKNSEEDKEDYANIISKIRSISLVHEKLQNIDSVNSLDLGPYLSELSGELVKNSGDKKLILNEDFPKGLILPSREVTSIGFILSELITNSIKHGFEKGALRIESSLIIGDSYYSLSYEDKGKAYPENFKLSESPSLGLVIVSQMTESLEGRIRYDFTQSKRILFTFPIKDADQPEEEI